MELPHGRFPRRTHRPAGRTDQGRGGGDVHHHRGRWPPLQPAAGHPAGRLRGCPVVRHHRRQPEGGRDRARSAGERGLCLAFQKHICVGVRPRSRGG
ncbi:hypothetical protein G6F22_012536 [Rhizopus arrhizus]|nr:hypothetical protein G6F22_012536 [Rhizopus arrhizus]